MATMRTEIKRVLLAGPKATTTYVATGKLAVPSPPAGGKPTPPPVLNGAKSVSDWTEAQLRAMMQAEEEEYAIRFWIAPTGTGTALRNLVTSISNRLDTLLNAVAELESNQLTPHPVDEQGLTASTAALHAAMDASVADLAARPAAAELQRFLNADGTMDEVEQDTPKSEPGPAGAAPADQQ